MNNDTSDGDGIEQELLADFQEMVYIFTKVYIHQGPSVDEKDKEALKMLCSHLNTEKNWCKFCKKQIFILC